MVPLPLKGNVSIWNMPIIFKILNMLKYALPPSIPLFLRLGSLMKPISFKDSNEKQCLRTVKPNLENVNLRRHQNGATAAWRMMNRPIFRS